MRNSSDPASPLCEPPPKRRAMQQRGGAASPLMMEGEVLEMIGVSERKLRAMKSAGQFPRPVQLPGGRLIRYRRTDVDAWIAALPVKAA